MPSIERRLLDISRLRKRRVRRASEYLAAVDRLDAVADARFVGAELATALRELRVDLDDPARTAQRARVQVGVARKLYEGGRLSFEEFVHLAAHPVISWVFETRWLDGAYDAELTPIRERMDDLERSFVDDHWASEADGDEYARLEAESEATLSRHENGVLREFGLSDLAELRERDPKLYERTAERGRRAIHHKDAQRDALRDSIASMQEEAEMAGSAGAYALGAAAYGAAIEGLLALRCMRSPHKAREVANRVAAKSSPRARCAGASTF